MGVGETGLGRCYVSYVAENKWAVVTLRSAEWKWKPVWEPCGWPWGLYLLGYGDGPNCGCGFFVAHMTCSWRSGKCDNFPALCLHKQTAFYFLLLFTIIMLYYLLYGPLSSLHLSYKIWHNQSHTILKYAPFIKKKKKPKPFKYTSLSYNFINGTDCTGYMLKLIPCLYYNQPDIPIQSPVALHLFLVFTGL